MKVVVTVTREYEFDAARTLTEPSFDPPPQDSDEDAKREWMRESFWELCGWQNDRDHVDGKFVWLLTEDDEYDFEWERRECSH